MSWQRPTTRRRALVASIRCPEIDRDAGSARVDSLIGALQDDGWSVTFLSHDTDGAPSYARRLRQRGVETHVGYETAEDVIAGTEFDLALLSYWEPSKPLIHLLRRHQPATHILLDSHDLNFVREARRLFNRGEALGASFGPLVTRELNAYYESDAVIAVSDVEGAWLRGLIGSEGVHVLALAEDVTSSAPLGLAQRTGSLFTGNFRHLPNGEAVEFLCRDVLPLIPAPLLADHPVRVVGNRLHERVRGVAADDGTVHMIGWVPSVEPYIAAARLSIVPLLHGAGVKGKVLKSLAAGTPVVTTPIGAEGIDLVDGESAVIADGPDALADAMQRVLTDDELWHRLSAGGRELAASRYDNRHQAKDFLKIVEQVLATERHRPALSVHQAAATRQRDYATMVAAVHGVILDHSEPGDTVAVVTRGDDDLLGFRGRQGWHFPRDRDGEWAGFHPADSAAAITHLESMRGWGVGWFAIPATAAWWLDHYGDLAHHLDGTYRRVHADDQVILFDVRERSAAPVVPVLEPGASGERVLLVGTYDPAAGSPPPELVVSLDDSDHLAVTQRWHERTAEPPDSGDVAGFDWIVELDGGVVAGPGLLDGLIAWQQALGAERVQPTHISGPAAAPPVTERLANVSARIVPAATTLPVLSRRAGVPRSGPVVLLDEVTVTLPEPLGSGAGHADPTAFSDVHEVIVGDPRGHRSVLTRSPSAPESPELSVVIATYERSGLLSECLESFCAQTVAPDRFEVVVVDDGSEDDGATAAVLDAYASRLGLVTVLARHGGRSAAKNLGVLCARGDVVVLFDDDDRAADDLVAEHLQAHDAEPDEGLAVLGHTDWADDLGSDLLHHYLTNVDKMLFAYGNLTDGQQLDWKGFWEGRLSVKRSLLIRHGLHDQRLPYSIDVELGWRLRHAGLRVRYRASARSQMLRAIDFEGFCARIESKGRAQARIAELHPDPEVLAYTRAGDHPDWSDDDEQRLRQQVTEVGRLQRELGDVPDLGDERVDRLYRLYREVFLLFNQRGVAGMPPTRSPATARVRLATPAVTAELTSVSDDGANSAVPQLSVTVPLLSLTPELAEMAVGTVERIWEVARLPTEIVVIDNGSPHQLPLRARVERFDENRGVASAWNAGVGLARAGVVAILNSDCRVEPGWDEALYEAITTGRRIAFPYTDHGDGLGFRQPDQGGTAGWCFMLSRDLYDEIGPFDERFNPAYGEDTDYWHRAWELDVDLSPVPQARVSHARRSTASKDPYYDWLLQAHRYKYAWKHGVDPHRAPPYYRRQITEYNARSPS